jgi:hypothetical protein
MLSSPHIPPAEGTYLTEPWLTKRQLATHLHMSVRWIEMQVRKGMPVARFGSRPRFRVSAVEAWLAREGV